MARSELVFRQFPKQSGWGKTMGAVVGTNFGVFVLWQFSARNKESSDLMTTLFTQSKDSLEKGHIWTLLTPSISHQVWIFFLPRS